MAVHQVWHRVGAAYVGPAFLRRLRYASSPQGVRPVPVRYRAFGDRSSPRQCVDFATLPKVYPVPSLLRINPLASLTMFVQRPVAGVNVYGDSVQALLALMMIGSVVQVIPYHLHLSFVVIRYKNIEISHQNKMNYEVSCRAVL